MGLLEAIGLVVQIDNQVVGVNVGVPAPGDKLTASELVGLSTATVVVAQCVTATCAVRGRPIELAVVVPSGGRWLGTSCGVCGKPSAYRSA